MVVEEKERKGCFNASGGGSVKNFPIVGLLTFAALVGSHTAARETLVTKWDYFVISTPDFVGPFRGNDPTFRAPVPVDVAEPNLGGNQGEIAEFEVIVDEAGQTTVEHGLTTPPSKKDKQIRNVLRHWRFQPAMLDGKPIRIRLRVNISNSTP
jgi:hypothetical protein